MLPPKDSKFKGKSMISQGKQRISCDQQLLLRCFFLFMLTTCLGKILELYTHFMPWDIFFAHDSIKT